MFSILDLRFVASSDVFEGYISASLDLAHEYMRIGKTRRATSIFNQALDAVRGGKVSDETSALFLLRFAESLALIENVPRR
jgi:separase